MYVLGTMIDGQIELHLPSHPDPLLDAEQWARKNPDAYAQMVAWARIDWANGSRCSTKLYIELLRRPHFAAQLGFTVRAMDNQVKIRNALTPYFARLIMKEHPELKGAFQTGKVKTDGW